MVLLSTDRVVQDCLDPMLCFTAVSVGAEEFCGPGLCCGEGRFERRAKGSITVQLGTCWSASLESRTADLVIRVGSVVIRGVCWRVVFSRSFLQLFYVGSFLVSSNSCCRPIFYDLESSVQPPFTHKRIRRNKYGQS